jgi:hypothetical protein
MAGTVGGGNQALQGVHISPSPREGAGGRGNKYKYNITVHYRTVHYITVQRYKMLRCKKRYVTEQCSYITENVTKQYSITKLYDTENANTIA